MASLTNGETQIVIRRKNSENEIPEIDEVSGGGLRSDLSIIKVILNPQIKNRALQTSTCNMCAG